MINEANRNKGIKELFGAAIGKVMVQGLDGIDGANDTSKQSNDEDDGAPQQLVPGHLSPSNQAPVEEDRQHIDQHAVAQGSQERQERVKEGHQAGNASNSAHDDQSRDSTVQPLLDNTALLDRDIKHTLDLQRKRGHQDRGSQEDVGDNHDGRDLAGGTLGQGFEDRRFRGRTVGEVAGDGDHGIHETACEHSPDEDLVPGTGVAHGFLDVHVDDVSAKADGDGSDGNGKVAEDGGVVLDGVLVVLVVQSGLDHCHADQHCCCNDSKNTIIDCQNEAK